MRLKYPHTKLSRRNKLFKTKKESKTQGQLKWLFGNITGEKSIPDVSMAIAHAYTFTDIQITLRIKNYCTYLW